MKYFLSFAFLLIFFKVSYGQGLPPGWNYTPTSVDHTIAVRLNANPSINGVPLAPGDYIGVFYLDNGIQHCGGASEWNGSSNIAVVAFGDDPTTIGIKDGFFVGEMMLWRIFSWTTSTEYEAVATFDPVYPQHDGTFYPFGLSALLSLEANDLSISVYVAADTICSGDSTFISAVATGATGNYSYAWTSLPPGFFSSDTGFYVSPDTTTLFICEVNTYLATASDSATLAAFPEASSSLFLQNDTVQGNEWYEALYILAGQQVTGPPYGSYVINNGAALSVKASDSIILKDGFIAKSGSFFHAWIGTLVCFGNDLPAAPRHNQHSDYLIENIPGTTDLTTKGNLRIFPNPANDLVFLTMPLENGPCTVEIIDILGRKFFSGIIQDPSLYDINVGSFPDGIYLIRVHNDHEMLTGKLIIK